MSNWYPREAEGVPCVCGGYADRVPTTAHERETYGCHRDGFYGGSNECCARAFVCRLCGKRQASKAAAPAD